MGLHSLSLFALTDMLVTEIYGDSGKASYRIFSDHHRAYVSALGAVGGYSARRDQIGHEAGARGPRARNLRSDLTLPAGAPSSDYVAHQTTRAGELRPRGGAKRSGPGRIRIACRPDGVYD